MTIIPMQAASKKTYISLTTISNSRTGRGFRIPPKSARMTIIPMQAASKRACIFLTTISNSRTGRGFRIRSRPYGAMLLSAPLRFV
jgi:hypothetical protein